MGEIEERDGLIVVREPGRQQPEESVDHPAKLLRIASMTRHLLEEVRHASLDERSRERLKEIYSTSLQELTGTLSERLQRELAALAPKLDGVPSESEIRIAQAQLVGWLEGLFHGIQAALWSQHMQAQAQFDAMRQRALPLGAQKSEPAEGKTQQEERGSGYI